MAISASKLRVSGSHFASSSMSSRKSVGYDPIGSLVFSSQGSQMCKQAKRLIASCRRNALIREIVHSTGVEMAQDTDVVDD